MNFVACHLKAATTLTSFPSMYFPSTAIKSSFRTGIHRSYCHRPCHFMVHPRTVMSRRYLVLGCNRRQRVLSSSSKADKSKQAVSSPKINERGSIWIYIGWTLLGLVGVDQVLQYKHEQDDNERRRMLAQMQLDADNATFNVADWDETLPTLFKCKILHVDSGLDGTKMLTRSKSHRGGIRNGINKNIKRGDMVEVIEAGVGPRYVFGGNFNLLVTWLFSFFLSNFVTVSFSISVKIITCVECKNRKVTATVHHPQSSDGTLLIIWSDFTSVLIIEMIEQNKKYHIILYIMKIIGLLKQRIL